MQSRNKTPKPSVKLFRVSEVKKSTNVKSIDQNHADPLPWYQRLSITNLFLQNKNSNILQ